MQPTVGGTLPRMDFSALLTQTLGATRRLFAALPVLLLLGVCLAVAPVQQFIGQRPSLEAHGHHPSDSERSLPSPEQFAYLCQTDPIAALDASLLRYEREVGEYRCLMVKKERLQGKEQPTEEILCSFREKPFSVLMEWKKGLRKAEASLFVEGENHNKIQIRPAGLLKRNFIVSFAPDHPEVLEESRYTIHEFGLERGTRRTREAWQQVREAGRLQFEYLGVQVIPEAGNRPCHVIRRHCNPPEEEGMTDITIMLDAENWLQVGSVLKAGTRLIGSYYFRDIQIAPQFPADQFLPAVLRK